MELYIVISISKNCLKCLIDPDGKTMYDSNRPVLEFIEIKGLSLVQETIGKTWRKVSQFQ